MARPSSNFFEIKLKKRFASFAQCQLFFNQVELRIKFLKQLLFEFKYIMRTCSAFNCKNRVEFEFSSNSKIKINWLQVIQKPSFELKKGYGLCIDHFFKMIPAQIIILMVCVT